jgi:hypothetical protein
MVSSGTRVGGCDLETPCGKTNASKGTLVIVGAGVIAGGLVLGTWTFPASKA